MRYLLSGKTRRSARRAPERALITLGSLPRPSLMPVRGLEEIETLPTQRLATKRTPLIRSSLWPSPRAPERMPAPAATEEQRLALEMAERRPVEPDLGRVLLPTATHPQALPVDPARLGMLPPGLGRSPGRELRRTVREPEVKAGRTPETTPLAVRTGNG